jgi:hypothetical protein
MAIGDKNAMQLFHATGGLFADHELENPVVNAMMQPSGGIANSLPTEASTVVRRKWALITDIADETGADPDAPCDDSPTVGDVAVAYIQFDSFARKSNQTKTGELDAIIERAHNGIHDDLFFVGDVRGEPVLPTAQQLSSPRFIEMGAINQSILKIARQGERWLKEKVWTGNPTANTANGGYKEFIGLQTLISLPVSGHYIDHSWVTGSDPNDQLNPVIADFGGAAIGGATSVYGYLEEMMDAVVFHVEAAGGSSFSGYWTMRRETWRMLRRYIPAERAYFGRAMGATLEYDVQGGMALMSEMQAMERSLRLPIGETNFQVVIDQGIPATSEAGPPADATKILSDIYFVITHVDNIPVTKIAYKDYSQLGEPLVPDEVLAGAGWTDGGRFHYVIDRTKRCFVIDGKFEPQLLLLFPQGCIRLTNVLADNDIAPLQVPGFGAPAA